jgi:glucosyl-dolichyl phosphate glucuronosyltransferase
MNEATASEPTLSVVVPTCDIRRYNKFHKVIEGLLQQSRKPSEIIVVANGSEELGERLITDYQGRAGIRIITSSEFLGAGRARNLGIKASTADIIAFTDDDSVPDNKWLEKLADIYRTHDAIAVGGKVVPVWLAGKPDFLPGELYWLVGATHEKIFVDAAVEVRNTFGPNMSYRKDVLKSVGYFDERLGFNKSNKFMSLIGGEEQDIGLRIMDKYGKGIIYNPDAIVYHDVPAEKTRAMQVIKRAFYFGIGKSLILRIDRFKNNMDTENSYLARILTDCIPGHIAGIFHGPSRFAEIKKLAFLAAAVTVIGLGFIYGYVFAR